MKQETIIHPQTFQTITTLECECVQCHARTRHVAHATMLPPHDKGVQFTQFGIQHGGYSFLAMEKIIQKQSERMFEMQQGFNAKSVFLHAQIDTLQKVIKKFNMGTYSNE